MMSLLTDLFLWLARFFVNPVAVLVGLIVFGAIGAAVVGWWATSAIKKIPIRRKMAAIIAVGAASSWSLSLAVIIGSLGSVVISQQWQHIPLVIATFFNFLGSIVQFLAKYILQFWQLFTFLSPDSPAPTFITVLTVLILVHSGVATVIFAIIWRSTRSWRRNGEWKKIAFHLPLKGFGIGLALGYLLFFSFVFSIIMMATVCENEKTYVHVFNQHLKELCIERTAAGECPQTEDQLRAFWPQLYSQIERCAQTSYFYDTTSGWYRWEVTEKKSGQTWSFTPDEYPAGYKVN